MSEKSLEDSINTEQQTRWDKFKKGAKKVLDIWYAPKSFERRLVKTNAFNNKYVRMLKHPYKRKEDFLERYIKFMHCVEDAHGCENKMRKYEVQTRVYEGLCLKANKFFVIGGIASYATGGFPAVLGISALWAVTDAVPMFIQRYNRARIYNYLEKHGERLKRKFEAKNLKENVE